MERVQKLLSNYGYCSRRKGEKLIEEGRVTVNDKKVNIGDQATREDIIKVDGKIVKKENKVYIIFNKPPDCVTAVKDPKYKTVMDYIDIKERVYPVGRLDYDASGLLILTNDGEFANKLMHPRYEVKKTYVAKLDKPYTNNVVKKLERGIQLRDGKTRPAKVKRISDKVIEVEIHEGKHKIVKRMFKKLGFNVLGLERTKEGIFHLGDVKQGKYIYIKNKEKINKIKNLKSA